MPTNIHTKQIYGDGDEGERERVGLVLRFVSLCSAWSCVHPCFVEPITLNSPRYERTARRKHELVCGFLKRDNPVLVSSQLYVVRFIRYVSRWTLLTPPQLAAVIMDQWRPLQGREPRTLHVLLHGVFTVARYEYGTYRRIDANEI